MKLCPNCEAGYNDSQISCPTHGGVLSEIRELKAGMLIHKTYRIVRKLGQGGMGTVYLADHVLMEESRALKFLSAELSQDVAFTSRFRREVRTLRQVRHKNVVDCGDLEPAEDDSLFFPMEFVDGPDLRSFMRNSPQPFSVPLALSLTHGIAEGLGVAHALGMVHRDIKPENILMARIGDHWVPKIADFGIVATKEMSAYTQAGSSLLTPFYAAPEQWRGTRAADLDGRTDIYALGGMLFELLTGEKVFLAENYEGWMEHHRAVPPRLPSSVRPDLANWRGLDELVVRMLGKAPADRPRDVAELLAILGGIQYFAPTAPQWDSSLTGPVGSTSSGTVAPPAVPTIPMIPAGLEPTVMYVPPVRPSATVVPTTPVFPAQTVPSSGPGAETPRRGFETVQPVHAPPVAPPPLQPPLPPPLQPPHQTAQSPGYQGPPATPVYAAGKRSGKVPVWVWALCAVLAIAVAAGAVLGGKFYAAKYTQKSSQVQPDAQTAPDAQTTQPTPQPVSTQVETPVQPTPDTSAPAANAAPVSEPPAALPPGKPAVAEKPVMVAKKPSTGEVARQAAALYDQQHYSDAEPLLEKACSGGDPASCKSLGLMYMKGLGVTQDYPKAVQLYTKACNAGNAAACSNLGGMLDSGSGVAKDPARAATLYQKACDAGLANGCSNLGHSYQYGLGVAKDPAKAKELLSKGCSLGNQLGCEWLQKLQ